MKKHTLAIAAVALMGAGSLTACGGGGSSDKGGSGSGGKGGTLYYLSQAAVENLDPQRVYIGRDINDWGRLFSRSLVQSPVTDDASKANKPVADLATDTGKMSDGGKTWKFTLKDGVKWEDGKDITCADLKYGLSRTFATDQITGGPTYALSYLDVPQKDGQPLYDGPYKKNHQADFDKAVTCDGKTITYKFNKAWPDFPLAIAQLRAFDPYRQDKDQGAKSNMTVFSNGPYKLEGKWTVNQGGTFVRNDKYDAKTDGVRKALPDKIVFQEGIDPDNIASRMIADNGKDKAAITFEVLPPSKYSAVTGKVAERATSVTSPFVDYLVPNFKTMTNPKVRQALALATNQAARIKAGGGDKAYDSAYSIISPAMIDAYEKNSAFSSMPNGDIEKAKQLLKEAGQPNPAIKYTYRSNPTADKMAASLQDNWQKAGFKVTLNPISQGYYGIIRKANADGDVFWAGWGPDWNAASTVIPPLFDSRVNLTSGGTGSDYGNYKSDEVNKMIDEAAEKTTVSEAADVFKKIDAKLGQDTAYIPLDLKKFYWLRGSDVTGYINNPAMAMYPDLGSIGVK